MKDEKKVLLKSEGRLTPWGDNWYFKSRNGLKLTIHQKTLRNLSVVMALGVILVSVFSSDSTKIIDQVSNRTILPEEIEFKVPLVQAEIRIQSQKFRQGQPTSIATPTYTGITVVDLTKIGQIPAGTSASATLVSGATDGLVKAKLTEPLKVDGTSLLPKGTALIGTGNSHDERLDVTFTKAVLASGKSFPVYARAFDGKDKILGLRGKSIGKQTKHLAKAIGFGVLGGMTSRLSNPTSGTYFGERQPPTLEEAALSGASKAALDQSERYMKELEQSDNVIEVQAGTEFVVIFDEEQKETN